ncbi:MAG: hypothetical protein HYV09_03985 [Deltaproteobacteria bacterium]|nr:hypothetical protein [Deltaproteobacteria bacterium]
MRTPIVTWGIVVAALAASGCKTERRDRTTDGAGTPGGAYGGGPRATEVLVGGPGEDALRLHATSALDVLVSARCDRARACSFGDPSASCATAAVLAEKELDLAHCPRGVDAAVLSDCARVLRDAPCDVEPARPETCHLTLLCGEVTP